MCSTLGFVKPFLRKSAETRDICADYQGVLTSPLVAENAKPKNRHALPQARGGGLNGYFWMQVSTVSLVHSSRPVKTGSATVLPSIRSIMTDGAL